MNLAIIAFIVALTTVTGVSSDIENGCTGGWRIKVNVSDGLFGCDHTARDHTATWIFSANYSRSYTFSVWCDIYDGVAGISVRYGNWYTSFTGPCGEGEKEACPQITLPAGEEVYIIYNQGRYGAYPYGARINIKQAPSPMYPLTSGHQSQVQTQQTSGFVYFALPLHVTSLGSMFVLDVNVYSYQGQRAPAAYVSVNDIPTSTRYDLTNTTVHQGDREEAIIYKVNPSDDHTERISVRADWTFNVPRLSSGVRVTGNISSVDYYQLTVPVNTKQLKIQFSRDETNLDASAYPIVYITQGTLPSSSNYEWNIDSNTAAYLSLKINDPNPANNTASNPGNYLIAVTSTSSSTSNYMMQCNW